MQIKKVKNKQKNLRVQYTIASATAGQLGVDALIQIIIEIVYKEFGSVFQLRYPQNIMNICNCTVYVYCIVHTV